MKHVIKKLGLLLVVLMAAISANAYDFQVNGVYYSIVSLEEQTCRVVPPGTSGKPYSGNIVVPTEVTYKNHGFKVVDIAAQAFQKSPSLLSVTVLCPVTTIWSFTFYRCENLKKVVLPETVKAIEEHAFWGCTSLSDFKLPKSVKALGYDAFGECYSLESITIPDGLAPRGRGGKCAFEHCYNLSTIIISEGVSRFDFGDFNGCKGLKVIKSYAKTPPEIWGSFSNQKYMDVIIQVPQESLNAYKAAETWKNFWNIEALK